MRKLKDFNEWLGKLPHRHKIVVAGNHDGAVESMGREKTQLVLWNGTYLENECTLVEGLTVFGTPRSVGRSQNRAFQAMGDTDFSDLVHRVCPGRVDVVLSHGPNEDALQPLRPRLFVSGHVHCQWGVAPRDPDGDDMLRVCACTCDDAYFPKNPPIVVDLPRIKETARV
jgi:predicted MPP superfamily phosphohydrolase